MILINDLLSYTWKVPNFVTFSIVVSTSLEKTEIYIPNSGWEYIEYDSNLNLEKLYENICKKYNEKKKYKNEIINFPYEEITFFQYNQFVSFFDKRRLVRNGNNKPIKEHKGNKSLFLSFLKEIIKID